MKNLTITVEEEVAQWARVWAARQNTSISRLVGELLHRQMMEDEGYAAAMQQYLSTPAQPLKRQGEEYPDRDALHDRDRLR